MLSSALNDSINLIFAFIIGITILTGILLAYTNKWAPLREFLPGFCGTLGIFGTFLGIYVGLSDFDSQNISKSIPPLLDGMKIAFFTSIIGMFGSMLLRFIYVSIESRRVKGALDPVTILKNIEISSVDATHSMQELIQALNRCFKSDEEYSLVSQVRLIRQEMNDNNKKLTQTFSEFSEHFSKMASESLVNELKKVVDKFNVMLNDLVSQSFIDLKNSTERLNKWQADYKEILQQQHQNLSSLLNQLSSLNILFNESVQRLEKVSNEMDSIDGSLSSITTSSQDLEKIISELNRQNKSLEASLQEIAKTGEQAKSAIPTISDGFSKISHQISKMQEETNQFVDAACKSLNESMRTVTNKIASIDEEHTKAIKSMIEDFNDHSQSVQMASAEQIKKINQALEKELTKSLESFAGSMVTLSQKFASDYLPLTEKLSKIVHIAEGVHE